MPLDEALRIGAESGFHLIEGNNLWAWPAIYLNMDLAPTNNKDFRNALIKAFDYNAMLQSYQGKAVTSARARAVLVPGQPGEGRA